MSHKKRLDEDDVDDLSDNNSEDEFRNPTV
jgi:hypothetical protein